MGSARLHRIIVLTALLMLVSGNAAQAQMGLWTSAGVKKDLPKGMDAEFDAEWRQTGFFTETDRWSAGASFSKRLYRNKAKSFNIKADLDYKYLFSNRKSYTIDKRDPDDYEQIDGMPAQYYIDNNYDFNITNAFWESRHRLSASLSGGLGAGRFKVSLRERVQYTYSCGSKDSVRERHRFVSKYDLNASDYVDVHEITLSKVKASQKLLLRSRIAVDYDIPHFKLDPFVSYELFSDLNDGMALDKGRLTVGAGFSLKKKHAFQFAYVWQNKTDDDESVRSAVSINYNFKF